VSCYCSGIWALCPIVIAVVWSLGTIRAEDFKDQSLYREVARTVKNKEWDRASAALDRWLAWRREHYGAQSKETGAAYQYGGQVYSMAGQTDKAIEAFRQALAIFRVQPGPRSKEVGLLLAAIAEAQQAQGQGGEAIASFRQALDIFEIDPGPETPVTATCLNKLSLLLLYRDAFHEAEPLMRRALKIREKLYGEQSHPDLAASLGNLGLLYFRLGAFEEAEEPLRHALEILNGLAAKDAAYVLGASNVRRTLASLYASQGKFNEAEGLLQRAIDDSRKRFGTDSLEAAETMAALGGVELDGKRFKEAEGWFSRALEIQSRKLPASHYEVLRTRNSLAICFQYQGNYAKARQTLEGISAVCLENLGTDHPLTIAVTHNLGMSLVTLDEKTRAREHAREFLNLLSDNLESVLAYFPEKRRLGFVQNMGFSPYDLAATLGDGPLTANAVLTFKAAVLESVARDRRRALLSSGSDNSRLVEQMNELRQQFLEAQLAGKPQRTREIAAALEEKEKELSRRLREDGTYRRLQQVDWKDVASRLPVGAVLLEFFFYKKHLGGKGGWRAWCGAVALAREREPVFRELGPSDEILRSIDSYLDIAAGESSRISFNANFNALTNPSSAASHEEPNRRITEMDNAAALNARIDGACRDLFNRLLAPFVDVMPRDGAQLFVCPDGRLGFVSFATLLDHSDKFIGSRFQVCYVDSGRVFLERSQPQKGQLHTIVLLGDPDFESSDNGPGARTAPQIASNGVGEQEPRMEVSRGFSSLTAVRFNPFPGTAKEVEAVEAVFRQKGWQTRLLRGGQATEVELRAVVPGATIVHLATHGYFMREFNVGSEARISNPMFRGWLALAGANATLRRWERGEVASPANDGILMAAEATGLDLSAAELIVLSACDTVKGEARNGEGILGLHRGVALAGAKNLLLSTWQIEDLFTVEFMKLLYAAILAGDSPAEALHKVQASELTKLREQEGTFVAVHLAGPFVLTSLKD
jgi:CHAT domain-containing protein/Tfp pilus assembly protein PilF